jgi:hypothetical protein
MSKKIKVTKHGSGLTLDLPMGVSGATLKDWKLRNEVFLAEFKTNALNGEWCALPVDDDGKKRVSLHLSDTINAGEEAGDE